MIPSETLGVRFNVGTTKTCSMSGFINHGAVSGVLISKVLSLVYMRANETAIRYF